MKEETIKAIIKATKALKEADFEITKDEEIEIMDYCKFNHYHLQILDLFEKLMKEELPFW